ncbi:MULTISPECIES: transaldolase [Olivibacter]|jgi:transaldolase|uniref:Transaldolase n=1 Tax=Olivibacter oleidegradans TaxID=760123 RepID=A0ABV6HHF3_9SPHI|nr:MULTISPECIES: transaldolase [Olivibacter]MDM8176492.1 transaldolase [Olivibacter sp. 47]QEL00752.1 transaldolase [Olivibacter sp. LS-1]
MKNPLAKIPDFGQSIWLDYIKRSFIQSGELKKLIDEDNLRGVTSNPAIFEEAIARSEDYNDTISELGKTDISNEEIFLKMAIEDVQHAADVFKGVYEQTKGLDGYVSLEVSPGLALDTEGSIAEARSSWKALDRPNVMIKIPGTKEGLPAIKQLISEGININVTLLFGLDRYREVAEAYIAGLEERAERGEPLEKVTSVASFFLSRIDTMVDTMLDEVAENDPSKATAAKQIKGQVAIASAKVAYSIYNELFMSDRFLELEAKGAKPQRLLWASTSVKNKAYDDLMYVEALIGPQTVDTLPKETLNAYRDHGNPAARLKDDLEHARYTLYKLEDIVGIKLSDVTQHLEEEGIQKFIKPFDSLMDVLAQKRKEVVS